ncbi:FUSC family protein [Streptomyces sp. NPDC002187]|uniref:FUSC family protein n=1 Tax=Streptomyces sp. NPDC002187 TaxID=3364637 RepID=UPI0036CCFA87
MTRAESARKGGQRHHFVPSGPDRTAIVHRAVRVTVAASAGFYPFVYVVDRPETAIYALFGPVALGAMSQIPGSGRQRAAVMLRALPVGLLLVVLGTVLAVSTWAAVLGMLVVGFVLAFAAVAGPRAAGAAPGLQLCYILACFPPYAPQALGDRLTGITLGVLVLALCEVFLLPAPAAVPYRERLADAIATAASAAGDETAARPPPEQAAIADQLRATGRNLRLSSLPPAERPAGPGRADRALAHAGTAARRLLDQLAHSGDLQPAGDPPPGSSADAEADAASAGLLARVSALCDAVAAALRTGKPLPAAGLVALDTAIREFQAQRLAQASGPPHRVPDGRALRRQAAVLGTAVSVRTLYVSVMVGLDGRRTDPIPPQELFWYADASAPALWWRRLAGNMTLRSVQFQNAVRIAVGLGAARLVAGSLDLEHGFWVLLAVLTLGRTTVWETWSAVRSAVIGTLLGAVAAGTLLFVAGQHTNAYAVLLAPGMLAAFALGPLLGIAWAQALFTLVVAAAFAQLAPASWQLAEIRIEDVVTGSAIGLLCGLLAWPAGARREVRRTMGALLHACAPLVPGTVRGIVAEPPGSVPPPSTIPALHCLRLAEAAYLQFRSEPGERPAAMWDWHAVLIAANHVLLGVHSLPRIDQPTVAIPPDAVARVGTAADQVALATDRVAELCAEGAPRRTPVRSVFRPSTEPPVSPPLPVLIDLEQWLGSLAAQLARIESPSAPAPG